MVTLLEAAKDSERTYRESLLSIYQQEPHTIEQQIEEYKKDKLHIFNHIKQAPLIHGNPIIKKANGCLEENQNTFEKKGGFFLKTSEIKEFYENGFISNYGKFPFLTETDLKTIEHQYIDYQNKAFKGEYAPEYCNLPDYVGHLYIPSIVKLLHDNYQYIVQKSTSLFDVDEKELFFSVGTFVVDGNEKGENIHQDYTYYVLDQSKQEILTSLITFHTAITHNGVSRLHLFPGTHKEILHTLNILYYLYLHKIPIDDELAMISACLSDLITNIHKLPYENREVYLYSHLARYPQLIYILNKYKHDNIVAHEVKTSPGEFVLFDPAILHSNGASSATLDELVKCFEQDISAQSISRLSLAIRVMHKKNAEGHFLWMSAQEKKETFQDFFDLQCSINKTNKLNINKSSPSLYTVLSNNKLTSSDSPYFSVEEMYRLHESSGAYK
jgi:hypothetical protein